MVGLVDPTGEVRVVGTAGLKDQSVCEGAWRSQRIPALRLESYRSTAAGVIEPHCLVAGPRRGDRAVEEVPAGIARVARLPWRGSAWDQLIPALDRERTNAG